MTEIEISDHVVDLTSLLRVESTQASMAVHHPDDLHGNSIAEVSVDVVRVELIYDGKPQRSRKIGACQRSKVT